MRTQSRKVTLALPLLMLAACEGGGPVQPTAPSSPPGLAFEVAGLVTDERGAPMPRATVTMGYWLGGLLHRPSALTDASGSYKFSFTANPLGNGFVARADVVADGYEEYWRSIMRSTGTTSFIENIRLDRIVRIAAGESIVLSVPPDVGDCRGWVAELCPIVRVTVPAERRVSIEVHRVGQSGDLPPVEVCCVGGDEQSGNPITVPVAAGRELEVKVGLRRGFTAPLSFLVKTTLETSIGDPSLSVSARYRAVSRHPQSRSPYALRRGGVQPSPQRR